MFLYQVRKIVQPFYYILTFNLFLTDSGEDKRDSMVDKVKRLLRVDSDDTEELHNKFRETSRDREEKIKLFEEQLNIKARKL